VEKSEVNDKLKILLVEDNELNQKFAIAVIRRLGYSYELAENGLIGLNKFKEGNFDLILMDIQMPEMNGIEATVAIRQHEKNNKVQNPIPIVAVTAFAMDQDKRNCMEAGMSDFLTKPYKPYDLELKIKNFFP